MKTLGGFRAFLLVAALLLLLRFGLNYLRVPGALAGTLSVLLTVIFVAVPIFAIFVAAADRWSAVRAYAMLVLGVSAQALSIALLRTVFHEKSGALPNLLDAIGQTGLMFWTLGLGALLGVFLRDKNLLLPISIFLAGFDAFVIFSPVSPTRRLMESRPEVLSSIAAKVPSVAPTGDGLAVVGPGAYIGPADFIFIGMFFVALHKFGMRARDTLLWLIPALIGYLGIVLFFGNVRLGPIQLGMLPALVPIGLTVLIVNAREFTMTGQEKVLTWIVAAISVGLAVSGVLLARKAPTTPVAPETPVGVPANPGSPNSPAPGGPGLPSTPIPRG